MYPDDYRSKSAAPKRPGTRRVLVVGVGALGCAAARTLAAAPSITTTLVDDDLVELSNLQRQVLFDDNDIGRLKVEVAAARLRKDFDANITTKALRFDANRGPEWVNAHDIVIDATDDPATKFLIARVCADLGTPYVYGGVARTGGQWLLVTPGESACLECVYPTPSEDSGAQDTAGCAALGILAPVAGLVGAMQAIEVLTFFHRPERATAGRLHLYEITGARARHINFPRVPGCYCQRAIGHRNRSQTDPQQANQAARAITIH